MQKHVAEIELVLADGVHIQSRFDFDKWKQNPEQGYVYFCPFCTDSTNSKPGWVIKHVRDSHPESAGKNVYSYRAVVMNNGRADFVPSTWQDQLGRAFNASGMLLSGQSVPNVQLRSSGRRERRAAARFQPSSVPAPKRARATKQHSAAEDMTTSAEAEAAAVTKSSEISAASAQQSMFDFVLKMQSNQAETAKAERAAWTAEAAAAREERARQADADRRERARQADADRAFEKEKADADRAFGKGKKAGEEQQSRLSEMKLGLTGRLQLNNQPANGPQELGSGVPHVLDMLNRR